MAKIKKLLALGHELGLLFKKGMYSCIPHLSDFGYPDSPLSFLQSNNGRLISVTDGLGFLFIKTEIRLQCT